MSQEIEPSLSFMAYTPQITAFSPSCAKSWLQHCNRQFLLANITQEETKVAYLDAAFDEETRLNLRDILDLPFFAGQFKKLSDAIIERYSKSKAAVFNDYFVQFSTVPRYKKASAFLRTLQAEFNNFTVEDFIKFGWFFHLSPDHQALVKTDLETVPIEELASRIDATIDLGPLSSSSPKHRFHVKQTER